MHSNISKIYLIKFFRWFMLFMPIIVLFFQDNGLSMFQVLLLQTLYSIGIFVFEIPSGYLADLHSIRTAFIVSGIVFAVLGTMSSIKKK